MQLLHLPRANEIGKRLMDGSREGRGALRIIRVHDQFYTIHEIRPDRYCVNPFAKSTATPPGELTAGTVNSPDVVNRGGVDRKGS